MIRHWIICTPHSKTVTNPSPPCFWKGIFGKNIIGEAEWLVQYCFETTDWPMFEDVTGGNISEITDSVIGYIRKCIDDAPKATSCTYPNTDALILETADVRQSFKWVNHLKAPNPDDIKCSQGL